MISEQDRERYVVVQGQIKQKLLGINGLGDEEREKCTLVQKDDAHTQSDSCMFLGKWRHEGSIFI